MEIDCKFEIYRFNHSTYLYIQNANITEKDQVIKGFKGVHEEGKSHKDVQCDFFVNSSVNFPRGLQKHFPNLIRLHISGSRIKEISKDDLKGLEGLVDLCVEDCQLTSLPDDLLTEMLSLRTVSFYENKIEFASSMFLTPLLGRESVTVDLRRNKSIDAAFGPGGNFESLGSLEVLMELIDEKCIKPAQPTVSEPVNSELRIREMWISGKFSDLTIIAGEKEFKVHKAVLGMGSEVFTEILEEKSEAAEIKISEFSSESVEALLKFIYTNEASEEGNAEEYFEIAGKFKVEAMKLFYEKIIGDQLNDENALETFLFAHRFSSQQLKEKAFQQIISKKIPDEVPDKFMEDPENLKKLIDLRKAYEEILRK